MSSNAKSTEARADAKKDAAPDSAKNDAGAAGAPPVKKFEVGRKLGTFKRKLNAYTRVKTRSIAALKGEKVEADSSDAKAADADAEKKPVSKVLECYRLIRNFCITYNYLSLEGKRESYLFIPDDFNADLKNLLSEETLKKFLTAMEGPVADVVTTLPAEFDDAQVKKVVDFIDAKDEDAIIGRLKKEIDSLSAEFEVLKAAKKAKEEAESKASKSKKKKKDAPKKAANVTSSKESRSKSRSREAPFCAETMFKDMISQIKKRVSAIRFQSDDYQVFSEVQGQIDLLLFDASSELHRIKKSIKKKFENAQKNAESVRGARNGRKGRAGGRRDSDSQRRSRSRRNRPANSVFSKNHEEQFD